MEINLIIFKLCMAMLCGAVVGLEREIKDKAAGLRTHMLVCLGACLFGMLGLKIASVCSESDILRLAQGLLVGIGFLGGGVIFKEGATITGLTTAAGIWVMGAIGFAIGTGYYLIALLGTIFVFLTITLFGFIEKMVKK